MKETISNLAKAFIGESMARNRYTMYAKQAKKEGYEQIAAVFLETAKQEKEHGKWLFRLINELKEKIDKKFRENVLGKTYLYSPTECNTIKYQCNKKEIPFSDNLGCGCRNIYLK